MVVGALGKRGVFRGRGANQRFVCIGARQEPRSAGSGGRLGRSSNRTRRGARKGHVMERPEFPSAGTRLAGDPEAPREFRGHPRGSPPPRGHARTPWKPRLPPAPGLPGRSPVPTRQERRPSGPARHAGGPSPLHFVHQPSPSRPGPGHGRTRFQPDPPARLPRPRPPVPSPPFHPAGPPGGCSELSHRGGAAPRAPQPFPWPSEHSQPASHPPAPGKGQRDTGQPLGSPRSSIRPGRPAHAMEWTTPLFLTG